MEFNKKNTLIILIAGKARSGKGETAKIFEREFSKMKKKIVLSPYTKYLKRYIYEITGEYRDDEKKPRDLLQTLSSELIKKKLKNQTFFIQRQLEDIAFYQYFMDVVIVPDVRFKEEIEEIKKHFSNVISIGINRKDYISTLTQAQQEDITEISLDHYKEYDYFIENTSLEELEQEVLKIIEELKKEERI